MVFYFTATGNSLYVAKCIEEYPVSIPQAIKNSSIYSDNQIGIVCPVYCGYNTDSTDEVLPLGIYPEINVSYEKTNANASPAIYFDSYGHAVVPLLGGIAIRDLNAEETKTLG